MEGLQLQPASQGSKARQLPPSLVALEASKDRDSSLSGCLSKLLAIHLVKEASFCPVQTSEVVVCLTRGQLPWLEECLILLASRMKVCQLVYEPLPPLTRKRRPSSKITHLWSFFTSSGTSCLQLICWLVNCFATGFNISCTASCNF